MDEDDEDVYTLSKLGDLLHALFSTYKEAFLPVFDQILPYVVKLLVRNLLSRHTLVAFALFSEESKKRFQIFHKFWLPSTLGTRSLLVRSSMGSVYLRRRGRVHRTARHRLSEPFCPTSAPFHHKPAAGSQAGRGLRRRSHGTVWRTGIR